ncbi:MAG TPA: IPTL-CTERM sorting domain-containing protein [Rudaea sp.]|nr:IPTL-CTERM sorting domain-containing protein [Rudaea sp.]
MTTSASQYGSSTIRKPLVHALILALGVAGYGVSTIAAVPPHEYGNFQKHLHKWQDLRMQRRTQLSQDPRWLRYQQHLQRQPHATKPAGVAATLAVSSCVDDATSLATAGTLRNAVANAGNGDTIDLTTLSCSTITLTQGALPITVDYLRLAGPSAGTLTVDGGGSDRVFAHTGYGTLYLDHLTVRDGLALDSGQSYKPQSPNSASSLAKAEGGCIYSAGNVSLDHTVVTGCTASATSNAPSGPIQGGAVYALVLTMKSSTISDSVATISNGDGIAAGGGAAVSALYMESSTLSGNSVSVSGAYAGITSGGGARAAYVYLNKSFVTGNSVQGGVAYGGGISVKYGALVVHNSTISGNSARSLDGSSAPKYLAAGGGSSAKYGATISVTASTISGNTASADQGGYSYGGGLAVTYSTGGPSRAIAHTRAGATPPAYIGYSTIDSNRAQYGAGASLLSGMQLAQSTISGNTAAFVGGGVAFEDHGTPSTIFNTTVANNSAAGYAGGILALYAPTFTMQSSISANNNAPTGADIATSSGNSSTVIGATNLVMSASSYVTLPGDTLSGDPLLLPLANNGGPTLTRLLSAGSPAVGTGSNPNNYPYDQRGVGFSRSTSAGATNIGAIQATAAAAAGDQTPVPSLSVWAMGLLAGLLGWFGLRRHKLAPGRARQRLS